jgi:hypothetical protein
MVQFDEGHVNHSKAGQPWGAESVALAALNLSAATNPATYSITSTNDAAYQSALAPIQLGRKSKGTDFAWSSTPPFHTKEHWIYLTLPTPMVRGKTYSLDIGALATNGRYWPVLFDEAQTRSEAVHVNLLGYPPSAPQKYASVFQWMGDRGSLNLSNYAGRAFRLIDQSSKTAVFTGSLVFRKSATQVETGNAADTPNGNFLGADVYECDFSTFTNQGRYVIAVDGIGCSFPFRIAPDVYREAFRTTVRGLYHNRSGIELKEPFTTFTRPAPHNPVLTPGFTNKLRYTTVRMTEWGSEGGDPAALTAASKGPLTVSGWYQDAGDWDSYYSHLGVAQHLLFAYEVAPRNFSDGELNLPEGFNGLPDVLDEAAWLPRFLYRLRRELLQKGFGTGGVGLRIAGDAYGPDNPGQILAGSWRDTNRTWMVSGEDPWSTYRYAGACAHLAHCLSLTRARDPEGVDWAQEAREAYAWARTNTLAGDETKYSPLKHPRAYAAAALFRITNDPAYETQLSADLSGVNANTVFEQGEMGYPVMVHALSGGIGQPNATLRNRLRASVLATADEYGLNTASKRSLRWGGNFWMPMLVGQQTTPAMLEVAVGYAVARTSNPTKARQYLGVLHTTCDYFLGNNALNMTWVTGLGPRNPRQVFHIDAWVRGYHPGMIPYGPWRKERDNPTWVTDADWPNQTVYPAIGAWPGNERWYDNRYSPMNSEFTVHQNTGPAAAIFGVLCAPGLEAAAQPPAVPMTITNTGTNRIILRWPAQSTGGLVLQHTTNLAVPQWAPVPVIPAEDGTNKLVMLEPSARQQSFRLKWP